MGKGGKGKWSRVQACRTGRRVVGAGGGGVELSLMGASTVSYTCSSENGYGYRCIEVHASDFLVRQESEGSPFRSKNHKNSLDIVKSLPRFPRHVPKWSSPGYCRLLSILWFH